MVFKGFVLNTIQVSLPVLIGKKSTDDAQKLESMASCFIEVS